MIPLNSYIIVELEEEKETSAGGLYVPKGSNANAVDILKSGKVLALSESVKQDSRMNIDVGDIVFYNKNAITKIPNEPDKILIRKEDLYFVQK